MKSNEATILVKLSTTTIPVYDEKLAQRINGCARVESKPQAITLESYNPDNADDVDNSEKELVLNEKNEFTIFITTSAPPVEYPEIRMKWNNGFEMLSHEGWASSMNEENTLELTEPSGDQLKIRVVLDSESEPQQIGIVLVGTGELP